MPKTFDHPATKTPELLSPAGDWDAMGAAVVNGADAVYFGLDQFNARHRATNFRLDELPAIVDYLHGHNVKGFLTFNTLIFSDELPDADRYIKAIAASGIDAVIVQDLGLAALIHRIAPTLAVHGSTQMTLTEPRGIDFVARLGVRRVVLARELSVADIAKVRDGTSMPVEVFIHGALCVAYSGQCLTSESLGGRSANRGQCAQACRLPYDLVVDGGVRSLEGQAYLLSPQDLAAPDLVGDLTRLGVASLKIEGRLKSAHYVAATTQTYRAALDSAALDEKFNLDPARQADLEQTFSRGFSHGFLSGVDHQELVTARSPKSRGRRVGVVRSITRSGFLLDIPGDDPSPLKPGDGIVFDEGHPDQDEQGGRIFVVNPREKNQIEIELGRNDINPTRVSVGAIVWKTDDPAMKKRLEQSFSRDLVARRKPVGVSLVARVGEVMKITFRDGDFESTVEGETPLEAARKFPFDENSAREQLDRLGNTPFELGLLNVDITGGPMVPKSVLNDLRRRAIERLMELRKRSHAIVEPEALEVMRRQLTPGSKGTFEDPGLREYPQSPALHLLVRTLDQLDAVLALPTKPATVYCDFEDIRKHTEAVRRCRAVSMPVGLATVRIVKPGEEGFLKQLLDCEPDRILVRSLTAIELFRQIAPQIPLIADYSLNVANELTAGVLADASVVRMVPSYDLNWPQMRALIGRFPADRFEIVVHQHMPMFHMEHCVFAHTLSTGHTFKDCGRPCEKHEVSLRDRVGEPHPLIADVGCRNTVYNAQSQSAAEYLPAMKAAGVNHFRIELLREKPEEVAPLIERYTDVLAGRSDGKTAVRSLRVLNQLGVTRGTFERE